jgi:tetratricopeptide (TPR) repeat protein
MMEGSIAAFGSQYTMSLRATNCHTGDSLARAEVEAEGKEKILVALGKAVSQIRGKLGESLSSIQKFDAPAEQVTTSSLKAFQAFTMGTAKRAQGGERDSIPFFKRAIELDPNFAAAYARLASVYANRGQPEASFESAKKAHELRDRTSERERFYIDDRYQQIVLRDTPKEIETLELWAQTYPRDWIAHSNLSLRYADVGQYEKAVEEARQAVLNNPASATALQVLAASYLRAGRLAEAKATIEKALALKLDPGGFRRWSYQIVLDEGDTAGSLKLEEQAKDTPGEAEIVSIQSRQATSLGEFRRARQLASRSSQIALRFNARQNAADVLTDLALADAYVGNHTQSREEAIQALRLAPASGLAVGSARAAAQTFALSGDTRQTLTMMNDLDTYFPTDTLLHALTFSVIRAAIELNQDNGGKALAALEQSRPYDRLNIDIAYLRGMAYLKTKSAAEAAAQFQIILDHPTLLFPSILHSLAHLGLARAAALAGDIPRSRKSYQDFFALEKDADPDIPILAQAKAEYAALPK